MNRFLLLLFCLLGVITLQAQTVSKIELLHNLNIQQDYDYVTTWSDSLLHFYRVDFGASDYTLKHWTCNSSGVYSAQESIFFFQSDQPWVSVPTNLSGSYYKSYGNLYLQFTIDGNFHLMCIPETGQIQHDLILDAGYKQYFLFSPDYLYYGQTADIYSPTVIKRYNINTNAVDSLFTWPNMGRPRIQNIANRFLLLYSQSMNGQSIDNAILIDEQLSLHNCNLSLPPNMIDVYIDSQEFSPNVYFANVVDGLLRTGYYGYVVINNFNIDFIAISILDEMTPYPETHVFSYVIPYGNGRFSCLTNYVWNEILNQYRNYQFTGTEFIQDFDFPDLHTIANPQKLIRMNSRYGLAISGLNSSPRHFTLIDYQNSALSDTTYSMTLAPYIGSANVYFAHNNLYYVYKTYNARRLYIFKIVEYTANTDPVQTPQVISCSAYPNPFIDNTTIKVSLKQPEAVTTSIYNLKGQLVRTLSSQGKAEFSHELVWDGKTDNGNVTAPGIYMYKTSTLSGKSITGKFIHLK